MVIFEKEPQIGGRVKLVEIAGIPIELGASIVLVTPNDHMAQLRKLWPKELELRPSHEDTAFGVWDFESKQFIFTQKPSRIPFMGSLHIVREFGILTPFRFNSHISSKIGKFMQVYEIQERGETFSTVEQLFQNLGLYDLTQTTLRDSLIGTHWNPGVLGRDGERFFQSLVIPGDRVNYMQGDQMNALCGIVSFANRKFGTYARGNILACQKMLEASEAQLSTNTLVESISLKPNSPSSSRSEFVLVTRDTKHGTQQCSLFDVVIVATPLEFARLQFGDGVVSKDALTMRPYQPCLVTLVAAQSIRPSYFGQQDEGVHVPQFVMTRQPQQMQDTPFNSLSQVGRNEKLGINVYKLFSKQEASDEMLDSLFVDRSETFRHKWFAYPVQNPRNPFPPIILRPNLFYVNAFETPISCMETEMIAAKNIAMLISKQFHLHKASPQHQHVAAP